MGEKRKQRLGEGDDTSGKPGIIRGWFPEIGTVERRASEERHNNGRKKREMKGRDNERKTPGKGYREGAVRSPSVEKKGRFSTSIKRGVNAGNQGTEGGVEEAEISTTEEKTKAKKYGFGTSY